MIGRIIKRVLLSILGILLCILLLPFTPSTRSSKVNDYSNIIGDNVRQTGLITPLVTDIAMLGAHDAFTNKINFFSGTNKNEGGIVNNFAVKTLGRGLMVRLAKAQCNGAADLLKAGVRYLDVRITRLCDTYYTHHGMLSEKLDYYVKDVVDFLKDHPKEFVIFDIQHFESDQELNDEEYDKLFSYLSYLGLFEHVNYSGLLGQLNLLTYKMVTDGFTKGGVIIMAKNNHYDSRILLRDGNAAQDGNANVTIRSYWHDTNNYNELVFGINAEYQYIVDHNNEDSKYRYVFRVNQAVITAMQSNATILNSIMNWSLLNMAAKANSMFVADKEAFNTWLSAMPIFMVDYSTSNRGDFNKLPNEYIAEYNRGL